MRRLAAMLCALLLLPVGLARAQTGCPAPASLTLTVRPLPHVAAALRSGGPIDVLALGSASLLGPRGGLAGSMPERMVEDLRAALPGVTVRLALRAGRTESAAEARATLTEELARHHYQLVLWQTGTVEALRRSPPAALRRELMAGVGATTQAGADLVLIDMQWSHLLASHADLAPYRAVMAEAAVQPGVVLFPRYALTRAWAQEGDIDPEQSQSGHHRQAAARLRACLGDALARMMLAALRAPGGT